MSLDDPADQALLDLLHALAAAGYRFITPTPATHARVAARPDKVRAKNMRDVFGWSLPFEPSAIAPELLDLLRRADGVEAAPEGLKSRYRVASVGEHLFLHSAYPTEAEDSVFFGPDSYRFAAFIEAELGDANAGRLVDIGAGAGVGAIVAAGLWPDAAITMTDVNPKALRLARINAAFASVSADTLETDGLEGVEPGIAAALANPPYIADAAGRDYRDGGDMHGARLSLDLATAAASKLAPSGRLLLYTGAAMVDGHDALREHLEPAMEEAGCTLSYRELDPDVFGEELDQPPYADVERIALVGAVAVKRR